jgi:hypothetical protein
MGAEGDLLTPRLGKGYANASPGGFAQRAAEIGREV